MEVGGSGLTRRGFLGVAGGAMLVAGGVAAPSMARGETLIEPRRIHSANGRLRVRLMAEERRAHVAGAWREAFTYNGRVPGPTLVADPGDRIDLRLENRTRHPTNVHTHGFHVSPEGNADNVFLHIAPGETFDYRFDLPLNHAPGLNWYHPHDHVHGTPQIFGGLAGAIVIRSEEERRRRLPPMKDRVLVVQAPEWDEEGRLKTWSANLLDTQLRLINGQLNPSIRIRRGETQRWRIVNATVSDLLDLRLDGHRLVQIAADGNPWARAVEPEGIHIPPGGRAEVLVTGGDPGSYALRAMPTDHGAGFVQPELVVATVDVGTGRGLTWRPDPMLKPFCDLRDFELDNRRRVTFSMRGGFVIDGKKFDPSRTDQVIELGAVEEWTVVNDSPLVHPFHIHVNPFQLTHVNGRPVEEPGYRDTLTVAPLGGSITFRTMFADFPGRSVFHCHIVPHSDLGMMAVFEVVPKGGEPRGGDPPDALCRL